MTPREQTPDVLGKLMGGKRPAAPPPEQEEAPAEKPPEQKSAESDSKAEDSPEEEPQEKPTSIPAKQQASKPVSQRTRKPKAPPPSDEKIKATFYLSLETLDALEAGQLQLRRLAGHEKRGKVSKSSIVDLSLWAALEELQAKGEKSQLASMMVKQ